MFSKADDYERFMGRWSRRLATAFVTWVEIGDGDSVLDVGCGTGALTQAVRAVTTGRVVGVDPSQGFVESAAAANVDSGIQFVVGDARDLPFPDQTFDKAVSALVLNFVPDPALAMKEICRVTKPGGLVAAAVWDYGGGMQMLRTFWEEVIALDPSFAARDEAHMPLGSEGALGALWRSQGLETVQDGQLTVPLRFTSFDDFWQPFLRGQGPAGAYVASLSTEGRAMLQQRLRMRLLGDGPDRVIDLQARAWVVKGVASGRRG